MDTLFVFARAPVPGQVKTRLARVVGDEVAALLQAAFVDDVCRLTRGVAERRVLAVAGEVSHPELVRIGAREGMEMVAQGAGDLGARMSAAMDAGLAAGDGTGRVVIVGSDSPMMGAEMVRSAFAGLAESDVVLGPAEDGGYWIVGARKSVPWLFAGVDWGKDTVFAESMKRVAESGASCRVLETFWDVDTAGDLERLVALLRVDVGARTALASRAVLAALGYLCRT